MNSLEFEGDRECSRHTQSWSRHGGSPDRGHSPVFVFRILPESVRWLETRGESLAADDVIRRAARVNRLPAHALAEIALAGKSQLHILDVNVAPSDENHPRRLEEEEEVEKEKEEEDKGTATTRRHNVFSMLRHRQMRARSLILFYVW